MDLSDVRSVRCSYIPVRTENLAFSVGGIHFEMIYVKTGEQVSEGQLLATLETGDLDERLTELEEKIEAVELQLIHLEESFQLDQKRTKISAQNDTQMLRDAQAEVQKKYAAQKQSLNDEKSMLLLEHAQQQTKLSERRLISPMDGFVTYVRKVDQTDTAVAEQTIVTVADSSLSIFRAETEYWSFFSPGDEVTVVSSGTEYAAVVRSETELNLVESVKEEGKAAYVYFVLQDPTAELKDRANGTVSLILETHADTLCVPSSAITEINGQKAVYLPDENGMKTYRMIETGLETEEYTEILRGLQEGEEVIRE